MHVYWVCVPTPSLLLLCAMDLVAVGAGAAGDAVVIVTKAEAPSTSEVTALSASGSAVESWHVAFMAKEAPTWTLAPDPTPPHILPI